MTVIVKHGTVVTPNKEGDMEDDKPKVYWSVPDDDPEGCISFWLIVLIVAVVVMFIWGIATS